MCKDGTHIRLDLENFVPRLPAHLPEDDVFYDSREVSVPWPARSAAAPADIERSEEVAPEGGDDSSEEDLLDSGQSTPLAPDLESPGGDRVREDAPDPEDGDRDREVAPPEDKDEDSDDAPLVDPPPGGWPLATAACAARRAF